MRFSKYYRVTVNGVVRYESVFQSQAEEFAREEYKATGTIADIHEIER